MQCRVTWILILPLSIWPLQTAPCQRVPVCEVYLMRKTRLSGLGLWLPFILYWLWSVKLTLSTPLYRKSAENLMTGEGGRKFLTRFLLWALWQKRQARNSWGANSAVSGALEGQCIENHHHCTHWGFLLLFSDMVGIKSRWSWVVKPCSLDPPCCISQWALGSLSTHRWGISMWTHTEGKWKM